MDIRNCRKCGKIFNYVSGPVICHECQLKQEEKFQEVKKYISENRMANIPQIAKECDVETSLIQKWIREERLEFSQDSDLGIPCENCGAMIRTGRFCAKCKAEMANQLGGTYKQPEAPKPKKPDRESPRMRFLDQ
jgi:flagellar operon protein (TIGR03826 family)